MDQWRSMHKGKTGKMQVGGVVIISGRSVMQHYIPWLIVWAVLAVVIYIFMVKATRS